MSYNNTQPVLHQYFTNIAALQNVAVLQHIWLYEIVGGMLQMCQNTTMRVSRAWIKIYRVWCSKQYNTLHSVHNFPAGLQQAAKGACIYETSLFCCRRNKILFLQQFTDII